MPNLAKKEEGPAHCPTKSKSRHANSPRISSKCTNISTYKKQDPAQYPGAQLVTRSLRFPPLPPSTDWKGKPAFKCRTIEKSKRPE